jgi:hypothetical protein
VINVPPNPRVQRTRPCASFRGSQRTRPYASLRGSPLTRHLLGGPGRVSDGRMRPTYWDVPLTGSNWRTHRKLSSVSLIAIADTRRMRWHLEQWLEKDRV